MAISTAYHAVRCCYAGVGAWGSQLEERRVPFEHMQVWDGYGPGYMRFSGDGGPLGWLVDDSVLRAQVGDAVQAMSSAGGNLVVYAPASVQKVDIPQSASAGGGTLRTSSSLPTLHIADGPTISADLVVSTTQLPHISSLTHRYPTLLLSGCC